MSRSNLHQHKILEDGKVKITFCPYDTHNSYGYVDRDGYYQCNSSYCYDLKPDSLHTGYIDCITYTIEDGYWNGEDYKGEFEGDFKYVEKATWLEAYNLLKEGNCQLTEKTHKLAEELRAEDANCDNEQPPQSKFAKIEEIKED